VVMARYMKEDEESLDEAAGKSFVNAIWSQEKERVSESEQGRTCSMLSVFFFLSGDDTACTTLQVQDFYFRPLLCVNDIVVCLEET